MFGAPFECHLSTYSILCDVSTAPKDRGWAKVESHKERNTFLVTMKAYLRPIHALQDQGASGRWVVFVVHGRKTSIRCIQVRRRRWFRILNAIKGWVLVQFLKNWQLHIRVMLCNVSSHLMLYRNILAYSHVLFDGGDESCGCDTRISLHIQYF